MSNKKIMICDDDAGIVDMLELILESTGAEICSELNSLQLFDRLISENPDILILDLWMPVLSGDQVLKRIRSTDQLQQLPVIVISASTDGQIIAKNAGANLYLAKPFNIDVLLNAVDNLMSGEVSN